MKERNFDKNFIDNLIEQYNQIYIDNLEKIENSFNNLSIKYNKLLLDRNEKNPIEAWDFSIFNIFKFSRPEENLHSPFLTELLDTKGNHGQKDTFYKLFIKGLLGEEKSKKFINNDYRNYVIKSEEYIKNKNDKGNIDITIKSDDIENKFAIILENKWGSGDSCPDQLFKYYRNFKDPKGKAYTDENLLVIYLTKFGNDPVWIENKDFKTFILNNKGINYFAISYETTIYEWLIKCIKECKSDKVKCIIEQYLNLIKYDI